MLTGSYSTVDGTLCIVVSDLTGLGSVRKLPDGLDAGQTTVCIHHAYIALFQGLGTRLVYM